MSLPMPPALGCRRTLIEGPCNRLPDEKVWVDHFCWHRLMRIRSSLAGERREMLKPAFERPEHASALQTVRSEISKGICIRPFALLSSICLDAYRLALPRSRSVEISLITLRTSGLRVGVRPSARIERPQHPERDAQKICEERTSGVHRVVFIPMSAAGSGSSSHSRTD
jgi:hypothetical protein